jgi:hypothetical protein
MDAALYRRNPDKAKARTKSWREANPDRVREMRKRKNKLQIEKRRSSDSYKEWMRKYCKVYYERNADKLKARSRLYRENNLQKVREQNREYARRNAHKNRARVRDWQDRNPEKARKNARESQRRRSLKLRFEEALIGTAKLRRYIDGCLDAATDQRAD